MIGINTAADEDGAKVDPRSRHLDDERSSGLNDVHIEVSSVSKTFGSRETSSAEVQALTDVSLKVRRNEFVSIIGPSGCGKTTLLRIIAGLDVADSGEVRLDGLTITRPSPDRAVVFQQPALLPWSTVVDNVALGLRMRGESKRVSRQRSMPIIAELGLAGFERSLPRQLSGGMQQRVALARAFVLEPPVLLMDEPFAALDEITRRSLQQRLMDLWSAGSRTGLFVTHNVDEAILLADRVVIMSPRPGRIADVYDVPLPRPRNVHQDESAEFVRSRAYVWKHIERWSK